MIILFKGSTIAIDVVLITNVYDLKLGDALLITPNDSFRNMDQCMNAPIILDNLDRYPILRINVIICYHVINTKK